MFDKISIIELHAMLQNPTTTTDTAHAIILELLRRGHKKPMPTLTMDNVQIIVWLMQDIEPKEIAKKMSLKPGAIYPKIAKITKDMFPGTFTKTYSTDRFLLKLAKLITPPANIELFWKLGQGGEKKW